MWGQTAGGRGVWDEGSEPTCCLSLNAAAAPEQDNGFTHHLICKQEYIYLQVKHYSLFF